MSGSVVCDLCVVSLLVRLALHTEVLACRRGFHSIWFYFYIDSGTLTVYNTVGDVSTVWQKLVFVGHSCSFTHHAVVDTGPI